MGKWYIEKGTDFDVVMSSRIRLARNFKDYNFPVKLSVEKSREIVNIMKDIVPEINKSLSQNLGFIDIQRVNAVEIQSMVEKHLISPNFAQNSKSMGILLSEDETISIMVNEEDHLRIQCLSAGSQINAAYGICSNIDDIIEKRVEFAFDPKYGYLTGCPTNIGTGIRVSEMLHLPAVTMTGYITGVVEVCSKLGITFRGLYGENSQALGNMFQISNQITLGQTDDEIIKNVIGIATQIVDQERNLRLQLYNQDPYKFEDRIYRSLGIFTNARILSSEESLGLLSDVRLGVAMGIIKGINIEVLNEIMLLIQPANLQRMVGGILSPLERDIKRAEVIRMKLGI